MSEQERDWQQEQEFYQWQKERREKLKQKIVSEIRLWYGEIPDISSSEIAERIMKEIEKAD